MAGFPESEDPYAEMAFSGVNPLDAAEFDRTAQHVFALFDSYRRAGFTDDQAFTLTQTTVNAPYFAAE